MIGGTLKTRRGGLEDLTDEKTNDQRDTRDDGNLLEGVGLRSEQGVFSLDLVDVVEGLDFERGEGHGMDWLRGDTPKRCGI